MLFFGDCHQLPPVMSKAIFSNPFETNLEHSEQRILRQFWRKDEDSLTQFFELTEEIRCEDPWLSAMLQEDRYGRETWETYCFLHGLPTLHSGSWPPTTGQPTCGNRVCATLADDKWPAMRAARATWELRKTLECEVCRAERARRCRVRIPGNANETAHLHEPFVHATYVHPFNAPTYQAQQMRTLNFAKATGRRLLWSIACDLRVLEEDKGKTKADWAKDQERFLRLHEKKPPAFQASSSSSRACPCGLQRTSTASKASSKTPKAHCLDGRFPQTNYIAWTSSTVQR